jgi:hypothetical protein
LAHSCINAPALQAMSWPWTKNLLFPPGLASRPIHHSRSFWSDDYTSILASQNCWVSLTSLFSAPQLSTQPNWGVSEEDDGAAMGPLDGAHVHRWMNAPLLSGSMTGLYYVCSPSDREMAGTRWWTRTAHQRRLLPAWRCPSTSGSRTQTRRRPERAMGSGGADPSCGRTNSWPVAHRGAAHGTLVTRPMASYYLCDVRINPRLAVMVTGS